MHPAILCLVIAAAAVLPAGAADEPLPQRKPVPAMQAVPLPDYQVSFRHRGRELTRLHWSPFLARPFLYPLVAPGDHEVTRMGHPHDPPGHSHHNSVWLSHNDVNGLDFWGDKHGKGAGRIIGIRIEKLWDADDRCGAELTAEWQRDEDHAVILTETRLIEIHAPAAEGGAWLALIDSTFTPPAGQTVTFGDTAFGLIGVRMAKTIGVADGGGRILNSAGQRDEPDTFRKPASWVDYSGPVTNEAAAGVALLNHPDNGGPQVPYHTRNDGWMGACVSFGAAIKVTPEQPLHRRYGLWVHGGVPDLAAVTAAWQQFVKLQPAPRK